MTHSTKIKEIPRWQVFSGIDCLQFLVDVLVNQTTMRCSRFYSQHNFAMQKKLTDIKHIFRLHLQLCQGWSLQV